MRLNYYEVYGPFVIGKGDVINFYTDGSTWWLGSLGRNADNIIQKYPKNTKSDLQLLKRK